ncbi:MAG: hypothetical protein WCA23_03060 [Stellaceae bacterium]
MVRIHPPPAVSQLQTSHTVNDCPKRIDRVIVVSDAVAEIDWTTDQAGRTIMNRIFVDVKTTDKMVRIFHSIRS